MTRNYDANNLGGSNNPLYNKLRKKFSYGGKTIADVVVMRAIRDGYNPKATTVSSVERRPERLTTGEISIKRANSITEDGHTTVFESSRKQLDQATTVAATMVIGAQASAPVRRPSQSKKNETARRPLSIGFVAILLLCFGLLMYLVFTGMQINELNRELSTLRDSNALLEADRTYYNEQLAKKNDMDVILGIATDELGMVKEGEVSHVVLGNGEGDVVEVYESEESDATFFTNLLNAFTESFRK